MNMDVQLVILAIIVAVVWVGFGWDVWKNPDEVPDKCKFCIFRWDCKFAENGVCLREGEKID